MRSTTQVLSRWVREFAAGVDAGNAIRLGLPVSGLASPRQTVAETADASGGRRIPTTGGGA